MTPTERRAARLPRHRGPAAWAEILGAGPAPEPLEGARTADVVIVGAGFAGLSAARRLLQLDAGLKIVVLDAGRVAEGAAGRNSGFMIDLPHNLTSDDYAGTGDDRAQIDMNRTAIGFARSAVEEYGIDPAFADPVGKVNGAAGAKAHAANQSYAAHLQTLGEASEPLDARQMQELTGSPHYVSGLFTPGALVLQPAGYIRGLAAGLRRDVNLCETSPVLGYRRDGDTWRVQTEKGTVTAPRVILATNGHLASFGHARGALMQVMLFASMSVELDSDARRALGGADRWGITPSDPMGTTMRRIDTPLGGHRIITRTCAALRQGMEASASDMRRAAKVHRQKFDQRFPQLAGMKMAYSWAGHLCLTLNGVAVAREIEEGIVSACVQNGLGTARGTLTGMAAAERVCGAETDLTRHFEAEAAPKPLPPEPFASIGANAVMRWREWRARAD